MATARKPPVAAERRAPPVAERSLQTLRDQLKGEVPAGLRELEAEHLDHLASAIAQARRRQGQALAQAGERALSHVPRLLRGPIRRITG